MEKLFQFFKKKKKKKHETKRKKIWSGVKTLQRMGPTVLTGLHSNLIK